MGALTAWQSLIYVAKSNREKQFLIHGGSGGVGSFADPNRQKRAVHAS